MYLGTKCVILQCMYIFWKVNLHYVAIKGWSKIKLTFFVYNRMTKFERKRIISNDYVLSLTTHIIDRCDNTRKHQTEIYLT